MGAIFYCLCLFIAGTINAYAQPVETTLLQARELFEQHNYTEAQKIFLQALQIAEPPKNPEATATAQKDIATCYYHIRDRPAALKWLCKYLYAVETHHLDTLLSNALYLIGVIYIEDEIVDSVEKYSLRATALMHEEKDMLAVKVVSKR